MLGKPIDQIDGLTSGFQGVTNNHQQPFPRKETHITIRSRPLSRRADIFHRTVQKSKGAVAVVSIWQLILLVNGPKQALV